MHGGETIKAEIAPDENTQCWQSIEFGTSFHLKIMMCLYINLTVRATLLGTEQNGARLLDAEHFYKAHFSMDFF